MRLLITFTFLFLFFKSHSQVYTEKQSRHRFAQMTIGVDVQSSFGGSTSYLDPESQLKQTNFKGTTTPRILIGGTHFWGHADFQISFPILSPSLSVQRQEITAIQGVETSFKYFPWRIENNKLRPYLGTAISPFYYQQNNTNFAAPQGPARNRTALPVLAGFTFNRGSHLLELGATWDYNNKNSYYISRETAVTTATSPFYTHFSYRFMFDTTLGAEKDWDSGRTKKMTEKMAKKGDLNNFFLAVGLSSAWWTRPSTYKPAFLNQFNTSIMPDFGLGYYWHKPDINLAVVYRSYKSSSSAYGLSHIAARRSFGIEATKYVADYHGFCPFVGPFFGLENLEFKAIESRIRVKELEERKLSYGLTFGWDIRPNRIQTFLLRTNLRWFPTLELPVENGKNIAFQNIEFNFIQLVVFPERFF